jgi:DUF1009 family protein
MRIGIIAGSGQFPIIFAKAAKKLGYAVFCVAFRGETDPALTDVADGLEWMYVGQIKKLLTFFKSNGVDQVVMMGAIRKTRMFTNLRPDTKALGLLAGMRHTHDDGLLRAFAALLEKEGLRVEPSTLLVPDILAPPGCWTRRKPNRLEKSAIQTGWLLAKKIGALDIGQCLVLEGGTVLAVEAVDGTDATILRGGALGNGNSIVIKVCKPNQDTRFDIPAVGTQTIDTMHAAGATLLVIEAGKAVVFDRDRMIQLANKYKIGIVAVQNSDIPESEQ